MTSEQDPLRERAFHLFGRAITRFDPATLTPSSHILREFLLPRD